MDELRRLSAARRLVVVPCVEGTTLYVTSEKLGAVSISIRFEEMGQNIPKNQRW